MRWQKDENWIRTLREEETQETEPNWMKRLRHMAPRSTALPFTRCVICKNTSLRLRVYARYSNSLVVDSQCQCQVKYTVSGI